MSLSYGDQILWPLHVTIGNLDVKMYQSQNRPGIVLLSFIPIVHKRSKDTNNKDRDLKAKIYYLALKTIFERK